MASGITEYIDATIANGVFSPQIWSKQLIKSTESMLRFMSAVNRVFEKDAKVGYAILVASIGELSARDKAENTAITFEALTETTITITLNKWKYAAFGIEDIVKIQSHIALREQYQEKLGYAIGKAQDNDVADLIAGASQTVGTLGTTLTDDNFLRAKRYLDDADVPESQRVWIISPAEDSNLLKQNRFTSADYVNYGAVSTGQVPKLYGSPILTTTNLNKPAAGQGDNAHFHKEAYAAVVQQEPTTNAFYDLRYMTWLIAVTTVYGVQEMRDTFGVWMKGTA